MTPLTLSTPKVRAAVDAEGIGWITLNQPDKRNAISLAMWQALGEAAAAFAADEAVRVVVLSGAGGQSFAAGADISDFESQRANAEQKARYGEVAAAGRAGLAALDKPLVAMVQGFCIGGGLALALGADVRFASAGSRFGIPAARLGLGYDYAGVAALARLVGPSVAKDMLFSARQLEADEALRVGLVNAVVPADELVAHVSRWAAQVAANAPLTLRTAKAAVRLFERYTVLPGQDEIATMVDRCYDSEDYAEGRRAFMAKRRPAFKGR
jgi:enoyl-CoA hydratase